MIAPDELRVVPQFADLPDKDLEWLAAHFEALELAEGEEPFEPGAPADHLMVMLKGAIQIFVRRGAAWQLFDTFREGRITGILPYSRMERFEGRANAIEASRIGLLHKDLFPEMLYRIPVLGQRLIALMSDRVRTSARADQEREKMLALGKLSAGLAHELNNPAAAVRRAADDLHEHLERLPGIVARLARHGLSPEKVNPASGFCSVSPKRLSALELADREDELLDWLEDRGVEDAWKIAPSLAESGMTVEDVRRAAQDVPEEALPDVVEWIENSLGAARLIGEIHASAGRITELVGSVKAYSHMDRSHDKQEVQLRQGIESTLTMLGHELRSKSITVENRLPEDLPTVAAHPGELNQVWTNLIDNAIDAMDPGGTLTLDAVVGPRQIGIAISDSGQGIPADVLPRIFEPFFTTKDVGSGTGLGLEIVHRIISKQHAGQITVDSVPGRTTFTVSLPRE